MVARNPTVWLALAVIACSGSTAPVGTPPTQTLTAPRTVATTAASATTPPVAAAPPTLPTLLITDPQVLESLESKGLSLKRAELAPVLQVLDDEIQRAAAKDKLAGVDVARFSHRLFDRRFLRSDKARFKLAGVVNRPDRAAFADDSCGEVRLIYRLEYRLDDAHASKLPMTLGLELPVSRGPESCRVAQQRWVEPPSSNADQRAAWLCSEHGPLAPERRAQQMGTGRLVVNLQLVRWPSTVRPDLGGHAEYLLRSFRLGPDGAYRPERLENTIDAAQYQSPAQQRALLNALEAQAARIDAGTPVLPESLLAERAISVTPRGLSRLANRPFSAALDPKLAATRDFSHARFVKSPQGLLRRLDQLSCPGCHEARSVAGFHLLGEDGAEQVSENALALPVSPQVLADLPRRLRIAESMLAGQEPDFSAPFAERPNDEGKYGDACALGDDPSFAGWKCAPGLSCSANEAKSQDLVGHCLTSERSVGDACERGVVSQIRDPLRDRTSGVTVESCPDMVCNRSGVGFPGGMCTATCGAAGSRCGAIAILDPFNACLARGEPFIACIRSNVTPAGLRACDAETPCRDDYVCAKTPQGGACLPPYFVFQLRVDGHSSGLR